MVAIQEPSTLTTVHVRDDKSPDVEAPSPAGGDSDADTDSVISQAIGVTRIETTRRHRSAAITDIQTPCSAAAGSSTVSGCKLAAVLSP